MKMVHLRDDYKMNDKNFWNMALCYIKTKNSSIHVE